MEMSLQLHPSFHGPRPKGVRLYKWNLKFDGSGRGITANDLMKVKELIERKQGLLNKSSFERTI